MKTKPAPKSPAFKFIRDLASCLREERETGRAIPGFYTSSEDPQVRRVYWRRAAMVQAAYDNAPAGAEAIAAAVMRKLLSFRPKLSPAEMDLLVSIEFRRDVMGILCKKIGALRDREWAAIQAADDARRAKRKGKGVPRG